MLFKVSGGVNLSEQAGKFYCRIIGSSHTNPDHHHHHHHHQHQLAVITLTDFASCPSLFAAMSLLFLTDLSCLCVSERVKKTNVIECKKSDPIPHIDLEHTQISIRKIRI